MKKILIGVVVIVTIIVSIVVLNSGSKSNYVEVEPLTERIGTRYVLLHEIIMPDERLGRYEGNVDSDLYHKNEGWLLRNKTVYCSNRLIDHIDEISAVSEINKYTGNPEGNQLMMDIEQFKKNLVTLNELCVSETEFQGEKALEATLFIDPDHKIWKEKY